MGVPGERKKPGNTESGRDRRTEKQLQARHEERNISFFRKL
jgi:hypothetical protein